MSKQPMKEYGLLIERRNHYGTEYVVARIVRRENDKPIGCSSDGERAWNGDVPKHLDFTQLDGLCMHGFISDSGDFAYIGYQPEYRDFYSADLPKLKRATKTLQRVIARAEKDKAYEPGDVFMSFANALKLSFACHRIGKPKPNEHYDNINWRFMDLVEGRNYYRHVIEETRAEMKERKVA